MNHHPHFPGNIPVFSELRKEERHYFPVDDGLPLSDTGRLILLSHFNAIGKMWDELRKLSEKKEEEFKKRNNIIELTQEDEYVFLYLLIEGERVYIQTDGSGELFDTNFPHTKEDDECCFPEFADKIAGEYGRIWDDLDHLMTLFCRCLEYDFEWDEWSFSLEGNGIRTEGSVWSDDNDCLFEYLEALS